MPTAQRNVTSTHANYGRCPFNRYARELSLGVDPGLIELHILGGLESGASGLEVYSGCRKSGDLHDSRRDGQKLRAE